MAEKKKNIDIEGNVTCEMCGKYLGNISEEKGEGNIFALYAMKRCPECQAIITKEKKRAWNQEKRRKDKALKKVQKDEISELKERIDLLVEENSLLHDRIAQLKDVQFQARISELEKRTGTLAEEVRIIEGVCDKILNVLRKARLIK